MQTEKKILEVNEMTQLHDRELLSELPLKTLYPHLQLLEPLFVLSDLVKNDTIEINKTNVLPTTLFTRV